MDYETIDRILFTKGLSDDPAFQDLTISIEPIPAYNGCPLGLYFPVSEPYPGLQGVVSGKTIIIPPDAHEAVLLHELGHRHGHYYYGDLSETYAEDFRKIYQPKGRVLLYAGNHIENLPKFGVLFEEGEMGAVELSLLQPATLEQLYTFKSQVLSYTPDSEKAPKFYYGGGDTPFVRVEFTRGVDWLAIVGASLAALTVATVGIVGYAVYKVAKDMPWITPVMVFGIPASILLGLALGAKYAPEIKRAMPAFIA